MANAYGGHSTLPTVSTSADVAPCGLSHSTLPAPSATNHQQHLHLVEEHTDSVSPLIVQHHLQHSDLLPTHLQQQLNSGITEAENSANGDVRSNGSLVMQSFTINAHNGRSSPTASGSSGGGSRSSTHSLPSHSPALHHTHLQLSSYQPQIASIDSCGPTTVVTSAAIMGRLTAGAVNSMGNGGSVPGFSMADSCSTGSATGSSLSLLHHHQHLPYSTLTPHSLHHHHQHHPHNAPGLLDNSPL